MAETIEPITLRLPGHLAGEMDPAYQACGFRDLQRLLDGEACIPDTCQHNGVPRHRWQDAVIEDMVPARATVLDLGCGHGELLGRLIKDRSVQGQGIEMDFESVIACIQNRIPVFQSNLDEGLTGFGNQSFDFVILEETVQTLHRPTEILTEMLRVGRRGLVSFPNFGSWNVRLELALKGRMPITAELPYHWYDTPNIHLLTLADFYSWAEANAIRVSCGYAYVAGCVRPLEYPGDNLLAEEVLLAIEPCPEPGG